MSDVDEQQWLEFRAAREAELVSPHGWLCLRGFHWVPETPTMLDGLPGVWSTDGDSAYLDAELDDGFQIDGQEIEGRVEKTVAETGRVPWLTLDDVEIELLRRGGRLAIRLRAETSPERENFPGVPTYDYDPGWRIQARFHPYPEGEKVDVATHKPELRQLLPAIGEVEFDLEGQTQKLVVTNIKTGPSIEFHDPTNDDETPAWRQLKFDFDPADTSGDADGLVTLDFNRTINMWFAFTDHATCPRPAIDNIISVPVRAGEKLPLPTPTPAA